MSHTLKSHPNESVKDEDLEEKRDPNSKSPPLKSSKDIITNASHLYKDVGPIDYSFLNLYNSQSRQHLTEDKKSTYNETNSSYSSSPNAENSENDTEVSTNSDERNLESCQDLSDNSSDRSIDAQENPPPQPSDSDEFASNSENVNPLTLRIRLPKKQHKYKYLHSPTYQASLMNQNSFDCKDINYNSVIYSPKHESEQTNTTSPPPFLNNNNNNTTTCNNNTINILSSEKVNSSVQDKSDEYLSKKMSNMNDTAHEINNIEDDKTKSYSKNISIIDIETNPADDCIENLTKKSSPFNEVDKNNENLHKNSLNNIVDCDLLSPQNLTCPKSEKISLKRKMKTPPPLIPIEKKLKHNHTEPKPDVMVIPCGGNLPEKDHPLSPNHQNEKNNFYNKGEKLEPKILKKSLQDLPLFHDDKPIDLAEKGKFILLETIKQNTHKALSQIVPRYCDWEMFKKKVQLSLVTLVGEEKMKDFGYPKRTAEQVLIDILDIAGKMPCADVRVDEMERIKINVYMFLDYFLPDDEAWKEFGGRGCPIELVVDNMVSTFAKSRALFALSLNPYPQCPTIPYPLLMKRNSSHSISFIPNHLPTRGNNGHEFEFITHNGIPNFHAPLLKDSR
ncbi:hypothetical protein Avbf_08095 [Armadillidium vulgare]|nr:hypothetical protein Avbf_08095 [Armadillidium vulgare]